MRRRSGDGGELGAGLLDALAGVRGADGELLAHGVVVGSSTNRRQEATDRRGGRLATASTIASRGCSQLSTAFGLDDEEEVLEDSDLEELPDDASDPV